MTIKFDFKTQATSIYKLMNMADSNITQAGGAIHAERLVDYATDEFQRMTPAQGLQVLAAIDEHFEKKLLKDGHGEIIGYAYSKRIFVFMRPLEDQPASENTQVKKFKKAKS